ncbi:hypothetical protein PYCCODRAFT_1241898 [Trametes coccinea BRFM310]|uniref:Uncharacterized protein n=1 Tax=Trametes coccinea (strain BRFM310) TaxID=1353009 RepID=A0A1Y2IWJ5_TRAC3|nr:hypothetical protein PYCCODRAFT_1241898 [Trametes coccinea BRFM310]
MPFASSSYLAIAPRPSQSTGTPSAAVHRQVASATAPRSSLHGQIPATFMNPSCGLREKSAPIHVHHLVCYSHRVDAALFPSRYRIVGDLRRCRPSCVDLRGFARHIAEWKAARAVRTSRTVQRLPRYSLDRGARTRPHDSEVHLLAPRLGAHDRLSSTTLRNPLRFGVLQMWLPVFGALYHSVVLLPASSTCPGPVSISAAVVGAPIRHPDWPIFHTAHGQPSSGQSRTRNLKCSKTTVRCRVPHDRLSMVRRSATS